MTRWLAAAASVPILAVSAFAQNAFISLRGRIRYPDDPPAPNAPIQVKHTPDGAFFRTRSDAKGLYKFTGLADGRWDLTIRMPCCAYANVAKEIEIKPAKDQQLNITLVEMINGSTPGDDPDRNAAAMLKRQHVRSGPAPPQEELLEFVCENNKPEHLVSSP